MKTTAKILRPNQPPVYIPNAENHNGYLVSGTKVYFYSEKVNKSNFSRAEFERLLEENSVEEIINNDKYNLFLIRWGKDEETGYEVVDSNQEDALTLEREKALYTAKDKAINFRDDIFGYSIVERLPESLWELIKPFSTYHIGDENDMDWAEDMGYANVSKNELKGWYYSDKAIDTLINAKYEVCFKGEKLSSSKDVANIRQLYFEKQRIAEEAYEKEKEQSKLFSAALYSLEKEYMTEDDAFELYNKNLNEIEISELDITGHNIYGGGEYLLVDDNYLYIIKNNGHDGDDWSINNYLTGGAGAIAYRIDKAKAQTWMDNIESYFGKQYFACDSETNKTAKFVKEIYDEIANKMDMALFPLAEAILEDDEENSMCQYVQFVEIAHKVYYGFDYKSNKYFLAIKKHNDCYPMCRYISGNYRTALLFPASEERKTLYESYLPEWFKKDDETSGRFIAGDHVYQNLRHLREARDYSINKPIYEFKLNTIPIAKMGNIVIWDDEVVTNQYPYQFSDLPKLDKTLALMLKAKHKGIKTSELIAHKTFTAQTIDAFDNKQNFAYSKEVVRCDEITYYLVNIIFYQRGSDDVFDEYTLVRTEKEADNIINEAKKS